MGALDDVALAANVSRSTAARVLADRGYTSSAARKRVLEAAQLVGYTPNGIAKRLRLQRSMTIGLIVANVQNSYYALIARGVEQTARMRGYQTVLANSDDDPDVERRYLELFAETRVEGIVAAPSRRTAAAKAYADAVDRGIAVVTVDTAVPGAKLDHVEVDNLASARDAVSSLIEAGHTRIAALVDVALGGAVAERVKGYRRALRSAGLVPAEGYELRVPRSRDYSERDLEPIVRLLLRDDGPTAVFATTNSMSAQLVRALTLAGLRCPEDVSLIGFDDAPWMSFFPTPITAVQQPTLAMAQTATALLLDRVEGISASSPTRVTMATDLIRRQSIAPPRA